MHKYTHTYKVTIEVMSTEDEESNQDYWKDYLENVLDAAYAQTFVEDIRKIRAEEYDEVFGRGIVTDYGVEEVK